MKNLKFNAISRIAWIIAITAVFCLSLAACFGQSGGGRIVSSAEELKSYLDSQPANSPDKPIKVKMSVNDLMIESIVDVLNTAGKYVSLDLSGSPLTAIPDKAFYNNSTDEGFTTLAGIIIPNSVTSIGMGAFGYCTSLTSITIPNSVTSIGIGAFAACTSLTSVTIGSGVTSIGLMVFGGCTSLTGITIPNNVTSIGGGAFAECTSLTSVTIPNSVTSIEFDAFDSCTSLTSVTFQGTISSSNFGSEDLFWGGFESPFDGDLRAKYLAGGIGTYTRPNGESTTWTKQ
jgi:hypothetical protein